MKFSVQLSRRADKLLGRLDRKTARRVRDRIEELAKDPQNPRLSSELETMKGQRYARVGDWRIIYAVQENESIMVVVTIQHRSKVYKELQE